MNLIIVSENKQFENNSGDGMLRFASNCNLVTDVIFNGLGIDLCWIGNKASIMRLLAENRPNKTILAIPEKWSMSPGGLRSKNNIILYSGYIPIPSDIEAEVNRNSGQWYIISNGRFATRINNELLGQVLADIRADVIIVKAEPELLGERERLRLTTQGKVVGFRRLYSDSAEFFPVPDDWPHHLFVKTDVFKKLISDGSLSLSFSSFLEKCRSNTFSVRSVNVGGSVLDLDTESGLLDLCRMRLVKMRDSEFTIHRSEKISKDSRFIGRVLLGRNVQIDPNVVVIGPTIVGDNVRIEEGAVINSSIIGSEVCVPCNQIVNNRVVKDTQYNWECLVRNKSNSFVNTDYFNLSKDVTSKYRSWPKFSYARCFKRIADIFAAIIVIILFAPLIPLIALAIKLTSPGSVFFGDRRQGLHGKEFHCLKFRTMVTGADKIQEKLRFVSQVDGPQFKMVDDPRISAVGRFLRETYIDEIPQFFNVLLGQMSVVGPRPSPESENTLCPLWREARLSVRPGITGLWQISRTREPMKDFQEWILYDIKYVRNLSLKKDLWICWQTVKKLVGDFIDQF
jgi:lipopolysaccharide/colanic/teichoic acid biosynthesis glycosyltransferase